jgi:hypothetical protein
MLAGQLERRFGPLPAEVVQRIENAKLDKLHVWAIRLLEAKTLAEVFDSAPRTNGSAA